jgi:hypothetical protein
MEKKKGIDKWLILIYAVVIGSLLLAFSCKKDEVIEPTKPVDETSCAECHEQFYYEKVEVNTCKDCHHEEIKVKGTCRYF